MANLDEIKKANPIEGVVGDDEPLQGRGRWWRGVAHESLVVDAHRGSYHWNSRDEWGDVIAWVERRHRLGFKGAVEWLCRRAGLGLPEWKGQDAQVVRAARARADVLTVASRFWVRALRGSEQGLAYAQGRGWSDETIRAAGLGLVPRGGDLMGELQLEGAAGDGDVVKAVMRAPQGFLVYPHVVQGRVEYFSTRVASDVDKKHWNPPGALVGERRPYFNHEYAPRAGLVVVVEGQADAVTLGQWGVAAVALAGVTLGDGAAAVALLRALGRHKVVVLGLDSDEAGLRNTAKVADALGPMTRLVTWPEGDANAWLVSGAAEGDVRELLAGAAAWVERVAADAGLVTGEIEREQALRRAFVLVARLDEFNVQRLRKDLAKSLRVGVREFNAILKATRGEVEAEAEGEDEDAPVILVETPGGYVAEHLLEMVVVPPENGGGDSPRALWETRFACRFPDDSIRVIDFLELDGVKFAPVSAVSRVLTERVVQFPDALGEHRTLQELVLMIKGMINKYVDVSPFYENIATYYVLFSWLYDAFNTVPYLRMIGDAGTGKSRFIQVVGAMCYRPTFVTGAATVSPIFRILDKYRGTLVLDEADYGRSDESADIVKILNTGYQRQQGVVLRSGDKNTGFEPEVFVVYGTKVIATRKRFQDWALESRCLTYEAGGPTTRSDIPIDLPRDFWRRETVQVRNALLRYRLERWKPEIELDYDVVDHSVEPRLNQVTVALLSLIDDEALRGELAAFVKEYNRQLIVERGMTLPAKVLEAVVGAYELRASRGEDEPLLTVGEVTRACNILIDTENAQGQAPKAEGDDAGQRKGEVSSHKVGGIVRKVLHLGTKRDSRAGRAYVVVWDEARVTALRKRFGLDEEWVEEIVGVLREGLAVAGLRDADVPPEAEIQDVLF